MSAWLLPFAAVFAGVLSVSSPCCLPLIPGYLSYVSSLPTADLDERPARRLTLLAALLFVAGFTTVFTVLGVTVALLGSTVTGLLPTVVRVSGVLVILLGLSTLGILRVPVLSGERRLDLARVPRGPRWAFPMGMAFAAGWTPCLGPILATILAAASSTGTAAWGALLLALYSVGLGVPFVLLALGLRSAQRSVEWLRRHGRMVETMGGLLLVGVGLLFVSGEWQELFVPLQRRFAELGWPPI